MEENKLELNVTALNLYLRVLANAGSTRDAEELLSQIEEDFQAGRGKIRPNENSYQTLIEGYSKTDNGATDANRVLDRMKMLGTQPGRLDFRPGAPSLTSVMNAWGKSTAVDAMDRVEAVFQQLCALDNQKPSAYTYGTYLSA